MGNDAGAANTGPLGGSVAFERYTEKAKRVVFFARYEASQLGSSNIESEHLLLSILRVGKALSGKLFANSPTTAYKIKKQIEVHRKLGPKISTSVNIPLSEECKRILFYASEQAGNLEPIRTEHLFLGMLREGHCFACRLLEENGVALESASKIAAEADYSLLLRVKELVSW